MRTLDLADGYSSNTAPTTGGLTVDAADVSYDNATSGLTATDAQDAIDEIDGRIDALELIDPFIYKGSWNATTNSPTLADGTGVSGWVYRVTTGGTQNLGSGAIVFLAGDKAVHNGTIWEKWDVIDAVESVNGQTGVVSLTTTDISEGTNLYYTDERAQDAIGTILVDTSTIDLAYNDGTPSITASVIDNTNTQKVIVAKAGVDVGTRHKVNLIEGTGVTMTVADNAGSDRVDVTINASAAATVSYHTIRLNTSNGHGSTNTKIRRFTTTVSDLNNLGSLITYADSATNGGSFTLTSDAIVTISYTDNFSSVSAWGVSLDSAQLTTNISSITAANRLVYTDESDANFAYACSWSGFLPSGSVIRAHTTGAADHATPSRVTITVSAIAV